MLAYIPWWNWKQSLHHASNPALHLSVNQFLTNTHRCVGRVKRRHIFRFDIWYVYVTLKQDWTFMGVKTTICCPPIQTKKHWQWLAETTQCISSSFHFLGRGKPWWVGSLRKLGKGKKFKVIFSSVETASACARWVSGVTCLLLAARPGFPSMMLLLAYCNWIYHFLIYRHK